MEWKPNRFTRKQMEERRLEAGRLLQEGELSKAQIARRVGVSRAALTQWSRRLRTGGLRRLKQRWPSGRPAKLTKAQKRDLLRTLKRGALAAGFPTDCWTLPRIAAVIERQFGVTYHPNYLNRLLAQLGWSPQLPLPRAAERDESLIAAWLRQDWPRIKKSAAARRRPRIL